MSKKVSSFRSEADLFYDFLREHVFDTKCQLGDLLLRIRERDNCLSQGDVACDTFIAIRTVYDIESHCQSSADLILRVFHYYLFVGRVTPAEKRLFFYLFGRLKRC